MNSIRTLATVVAVFSMSSFAQAGLFDHLFGGHGGGGGCCDDACDSSKCCDCAPVYEPCQPIIVRPCHKNVYIYQRQLSCIKPPCNDVGCCTPWGDGVCVPNGAGCPGACGPSACDDVGAAACCPGNGAPCGPGTACCPGNGAACCPGDAACCPGGAGCCPDNGCCPQVCCPCDPHEACEVAMLIYWSQTQCDPSDREEAIDDLGDYNPLCYPEIMCAWIYALNDTSPEVRAEAADEIGDALEDYPCLCSQCLVDALTCALADCDDDVVGEAEEALEACGYEIVDECPCDPICCDMGCAPGCAPGCGPGCAPAGMPAAPMPMDGQAPAPAPPEETKAYFPSQLPQQASRPQSSRFSLSRLFSLVD